MRTTITLLATFLTAGCCTALLPTALSRLFIATIDTAFDGRTVTTVVVSDTLSTLDKKVECLERYVYFRRHYESLEFHITHHDQSQGIFPGSSDRDVRVVARVPAAELDSWIPPGRSPVSPPDTSWLATVPGSERAAGISEWYDVAPGEVVGIDRARRVVVYWWKTT
jgi:hypothetical protein